MLWTIDWRGNKTINLQSKKSRFSLECFLENCKECNKKFNEWTKVAETLQSEIAQVTVTFFGLQRTQNSSMRKHYESYQCYTETYQNSCKKATGHQEIILTALDTARITSCKDVIQAFRDNEKIFFVLFRHTESVYEESIPMSRIVNRQANRANPLVLDLELQDK